MIKFGFLIFLFLGALAENWIQEDGIIIVTEASFDKAISESAYSIVDFYSPKCKHCKKFAPEYVQVAQQLAKNRPDIKLYKVDITVEKKLIRRFNLTGLPTIKLFTKQNGTHIEYTGEQNAVDVLAWVLNNTLNITPNITMIETAINPVNNTQSIESIEIATTIPQSIESTEIAITVPQSIESTEIAATIPQINHNTTTLNTEVQSNEEYLELSYAVLLMVFTLILLPCLLYKTQKKREHRELPVARMLLA